MTDNGVMSPEVYSVSVKLRALKDVVISQAHGSQAYGLFLNVLRMSSQSLAEELHGLDGAKPFTVSPLQGRFGRAGEGLRVIPEAKYSLRFTFMKSDVFAHFLDGTMKWGDNTVELGSGSFQVEEVNPASKKDSSTGFQSYQGILNGASTRHQIELQFSSPTAFRSGGKRNVVFPTPELVFGSYLNRWQAFSPVKLDDSISSWFDRIVVARYKLGTQILNFGSYQEVGFTGRCRYELNKNAPEEVAHALNALADFAFYCGTGAKTTMGMGQTKRLNRALHLNK
ncbi:hypothetical protein ES708_06155 [subsurface metagenome]